MAFEGYPTGSCETRHSIYQAVSSRGQTADSLFRRDDPVHSFPEVATASLATKKAMRPTLVGLLCFPPLENLWNYEGSPLFSDAEHAALNLAMSAARVPNEATDAQFDEFRSLDPRADR